MERSVVELDVSLRFLESGMWTTVGLNPIWKDERNKKVVQSRDM